MGIQGKPQKIFCQNCGTPSQGTKFCSNCGAEIGLGQQKIPDPTYSTPQVPVNQRLYNQYPYVPANQYTASNILGGIFRIFKTQYAPVVATYAGFAIILLFIAWWIISEILDTIGLSAVEQSDLFTIFPDTIVIVTGFLALILFSFFRWMPDSVVVRLVSNYEDNREESYLQSVGYAISRWPQLILLFILYFASFVGITIGVFVLSFFLINISLSLALLLILIVAVLSIFISLRLSITQAFVLIAEENAIDAMKLSWKFMEGRLLSYFGASIVVSVIALIFNQIFETVASPVFESAGTFNIIALTLLPQVFMAGFGPFLYISVFYLIKINYESDIESKIFPDTHYPTITAESLNSDI